MLAHNNVTLIGNLGGDRKIKINEHTGEIVGLTLSLGVSKRVPDPENEGQWIDGADWFQLFVSTKNRSFEFLKKHALKGSMIAVAGYLRRETWDSKNRKDENGKPMQDARTDVSPTDIKILRFAKVQDNATPPVDPAEEGTANDGQQQEDAGLPTQSPEEQHQADEHYSQNL
ncbi:TPA: single-stranded DNA-binding protein [Yersinia enterocolitica]|nr:single-stranded DNA-binding protein [Yersinia enterocolitica]